MIELIGKHNSAKVWTDILDKETKKQIASLLSIPAYADSKIRVMPDTHAGRGCVIGMTMTLCGRVSPSLVGVDIGCGMEVVTLADREVDPARMDAFIHEHIPAGKHVYDSPLPAEDAPRLSDLRCHGKTDMDDDHISRSLGTLGGGNHFIELEKAPDGTLYLVIHSGSRSLGSAVANRYRDEAYRAQCRKARQSVRVETADNRDRESEAYDTRRPDRKQERYEYGFEEDLEAYDQDTDSYDEDRYDVARFGIDLYDESPRLALTKAARRESQSRLPVKWETAVCEGDLYRDYLHDMALTTRFATVNRRLIADRICAGLGLTIVSRFACVHNYIDKDGILRKGAISARLGEPVFIPLNMRDGALIGRGLGNPDWNFSAPHGAGRACSRTDARHAYNVADYQAVMEAAGVYTSTAVKSTIDECPMAYKSPDRILPYLTDCAEVDAWLKPIYNFKAAD